MSFGANDERANKESTLKGKLPDEHACKEVLAYHAVQRSIKDVDGIVVMMLVRMSW